MTEDEAFVRTIVDSPGDDLPRLVYADWLDERGDPRGAYLRAEAEWAKTKQTTGFLLLRLNGLADGLDPVWVACVSRPPVGVCCDHLRFVNCGPKLTLDDVLGVERRVGVRFADEFRAFLLNYNAGQVSPCDDAPDLLHNAECFPAVFFSPVGHSFSTPIESVPSLEAIAPPDRANGLAAIGENATELRDLFLGVVAANFGMLFSDCQVRPERAFGGTLSPDELNLSRYFARLQPKWQRARTSKGDI